jgi:hypothetical protein
MIDDFCYWFRYNSGTLIEKFIVLCIIMILVTVIMGISTGSGGKNRRTFCLDKGYDKFQISQKKFYCHNTSTGEIKQFPDPRKKKAKVETEKRSWE